MSIWLKFEGMKALQKSMDNLGKVPQKCVTKAAKSGASIALKTARKKAPFDTGELRKGIILKGEKRSKPGKKVYDVMMDPSKNDIFQKITKTGLRRVNTGRKTSTQKGNYYYPASMEFGFVTQNGRYIPGEHFLRDSLTDNKNVIEAKVIQVIVKEIDKAVGKG